MIPGDSLVEQSAAAVATLMRVGRKVRRRDVIELYGLRHKSGRIYREVFGAVVRLDLRIDGVLLTISTIEGDIFTATRGDFDLHLMNVQRRMLFAIHRGKSRSGTVYSHVHLLPNRRLVGAEPIPFTRSGNRLRRTEPDDQPTWHRIRFTRMVVCDFLDGFAAA